MQDETMCEEDYKTRCSSYLYVHKFWAKRLLELSSATEYKSYSPFSRVMVALQSFFSDLSPKHTVYKRLCFGGAMCCDEWPSVLLHFILRRLNLKCKSIIIFCVLYSVSE